MKTKGDMSKESIAMGTNGTHKDDIVEETMNEFYESLSKKDENKKEKEKSKNRKRKAEHNSSVPVPEPEPVVTNLVDEEVIEETVTDETVMVDETVTIEEKLEKRRKKKKAIGITLGTILGLILVVYLAGSFYFSSHFFFFTKINGTDFSLKSVEQVQAYFEEQVDNYSLTLQGNSDIEEKILGTDIDLKYVAGDDVKKLVDKQNSMLWFKALWDHPKMKANVGVEYDKEKLEARLATLECLKEENQVAPVNAHPVFKNGSFEVENEVVGSKVVREKFDEAIKTALNGFNSEINLQKAGVYETPAYTSESKEVIAAKDTMNNYLGAKVTYDFTPSEEVVDGTLISQWLSTDGKMNVSFNEDAVRAYIASLAEKYNTVGQAVDFTTPDGRAAQVNSGSFGWNINQEEEFTALTNNIKNKEEIKREPAYSSRGITHENNGFGNTYAAVDLSGQRAFFVQDGQVVLDSPVVTGNPNKGWETPPGLFFLAYKTTDQVLRGKKMPDGSYEYESPVQYWMPFNGGIGFHDASWQPVFGGDRYLTYGSRGCINMPTDQAALMYSLVYSGVPVVCYY